MVSEINPLNCVDVVEEKDAKVSDLYATSPPNLKFTFTEALGLSDVSVRLWFTPKTLLLASVKVAEAVDVIARPLIDVAVAAPRTGALSVGDVKILFVRVCCSSSVTNLCSTEPSHTLQ